MEKQAKLNYKIYLDSNYMGKPIQIKITAVKWLVEQITAKNGEEFASYFTEFLELALEMEEEQIIDAWEDGYERDFANCGANYYVDNYGYLRN